VPLPPLSRAALCPLPSALCPLPSALCPAAATVPRGLRSPQESVFQSNWVSLKRSYFNPHKSAEWRKVRDKCERWRQRDPEIKKYYAKVERKRNGKKYLNADDFEPGNQSKYYEDDLDKATSIYVIIDDVGDMEKSAGNKHALDDFKALEERLEVQCTHHLAGSLPSLAFVTGW